MDAGLKACSKNRLGAVGSFFHDLELDINNFVNSTQ